MNTPGSTAVPEWARWIDTFYSIYYNVTLPEELLPQAQAMFEKGYSSFQIASDLPAPKGMRKSHVRQTLR